jgi:hypothetical protein
MNPTPAPPTDERIEPTAAHVVALLERAHALARRARACARSSIAVT